MIIRTCRPRFLILLLAAFVLSQKTFAQKPGHLQQLLQAALQHYPQLMQKRALADAGRAAIADARHADLPNLKITDQLSLASANSVAGSFFPLGVVVPTAGGIRNSNNWQAASGNLAMIYNEYELVNFGLSKARVEAARAGASVGEQDYQRTAYLLQYQVGLLYFDLVKYQAQSEAEKENVNRYESLEKIARALSNSGIKPGADSSQVLVELIKARSAYRSTVGKLDQTRQQLAYYTGLPARQMVPDSTLMNVSGSKAPSLALLQADSMGNPILNYYQEEQKMYASREKLTGKSYLPKILLVGGLEARGSSISPADEYKGLGSGMGYQRFNYAAGLAFVYPIFDAVHRKDKLAIIRQESQASDYALQQARLDLMNTARQADLNWQVANANLVEMPDRLSAAREVYNQKTAQYQAGLINLIDLTNASLVLYRTQTDYIQTLSDWYQALLQKAMASGQLTSFLQTIQ